MTEISPQKVCFLREIIDEIRSNPEVLNTDALSFFNDFIAEYTPAVVQDGNANQKDARAKKDTSTREEYATDKVSLAVTLNEEEHQRLNALKATRARVRKINHTAPSILGENNSKKTFETSPERLTKSTEAQAPMEKGELADCINAVIKNPQSAAQYLANPQVARLVGKFLGKNDAETSIASKAGKSDHCKDLD
ncbi:heat shock protein 70 [Perkinsela sp. CCAP 1560/4]|nr:heat shock protein 70 [Perkinsela sp. CCAP 1560/4]|eukprot:KNH05021.1 heat shock protein 70 [Perkinsela sp. CCAP 1560/4]